MANHLSQYPILCASFNQDYSYFALGTKLGFKIFQADNGRLCYERDIGAYNIVEMRFSSSLLAIVGAGEQPILSPRRLCLFNTTTGTPLQELNFLTSVLAVRLNKLRLIVLLLDKIFMYDINSLTILTTIDSVPNPKGLCAFSHNVDACYMAVPASTTKGSVLVYNVMDLQSLYEIDAHKSPLAAIVFSSDGTYLATASEQGTMVRVYMVSEGTKLFSFRRGSYPATIFSLSFGPCMQIPDVLVATSSSGSLHIFMLGFAIDQRSKKSSSFVGAMIPARISDALDPAYHHVLHNVVTEGVKSLGDDGTVIIPGEGQSSSSRSLKLYAVIRKVEKVASGTASNGHSLRACISVITYNGYFREYIFCINYKNESSWTLEREYSVLSAISDITTPS